MRGAHLTLLFPITPSSRRGERAGKTTTLRMLLNDLKPMMGEILIDGKNINEQMRQVEIGFCPQFDWLLDNLTVMETLMLFAR